MSTIVLSLLCQSLPCSGRAQRDPGPRAQTRELDSRSPLGAGSRSGYAHSASKTRVNALMASAGTRKVCEAVQLCRPHAEERTQCASRSMGPPPSFETSPCQSATADLRATPQDEGGEIQP